jgi:MoxR-like ATPase
LSTPAKSSTKKIKSSTPTAAFSLPVLPSLLTRPLGLEGWTQYEPILVAALVTQDPMLLIGPHGSAKNFLLERLAQVLNREYRFYNASLINYDDLVGIPLPTEDRKSLRYISTASSIWDAQIVFVDEINRTKPELQNKLFPIIHEKRVQGIPLEKLCYRWAAMNPPPMPDELEDNLDVYFGTEPLDPALADRFNFIIEVPSWQQLSNEEKHAILRDQFSGQHPFLVQPDVLMATAAGLIQQLQANPPKAIEEYVIYLLSLLEGQKIRCSARRATMLHRNILAVHASRMALYQVAFPQLPVQVIDWNTSALLALQYSLPQVAQGRKLDPVTLLTAHRQAWEVILIDAENPWRELLQIANPLERCVAAIQMGEKINDDDLSQLILEGLSTPLEKEYRLAYELVIYLAVKDTRSLRATVYETMAQELRDVLRPGQAEVMADDQKVRMWARKARDLASELRQSQEQPLRSAYMANLLNTLIMRESFENASPRDVYALFRNLWAQLLPAAA